MKYLISLTLLLSFGCILPPVAPPPLPPSPSVHTYVMQVTGEQGKPLSRAVGTIFADSGELLTAENQNGTLIFTLYKETGGGWLQVSADGYKTMRTRVILPPGDYTEPKGFRLELAQKQLPTLIVEGTSVRTSAGPFVFRGVMAFGLLDRLADGQEADVIAFLDWARSTGFNVIRTLTTLSGWIELSPQEGQAALPKLFNLAAQRDLYVQPVALAGTRVREMTQDEMVLHTAEVARLCAKSTACAFLELANEPSHPSQQSDLQDPAFLSSLRALVPAPVPVAYGSNCCGEGDEPGSYPHRYAGGDLVLVHTDRSRDTWNRTRHVREVQALSEELGKYIISNEPIGAGEQDRGTSRSSNVHEFYGQGVLSRVFSFGATFHCEDCLYGRVPGPIQQEAARAFVEGTRVVADDVRLRFFNSGWAGSPVRSFAFTGEFGTPNSALRAYSGVSNGRGVTVLVGKTGDPSVEWSSGWTPVGILVDRPGVRVYEIRQ